MSSERADQPAVPDNPHGVPGQALATQREAMGWSVEQVADQLKLAVRQVVALEAGDYGHLPSPAVTRGFVRAYAKLLKMDPAPLVAQIAMDTPPTPDSSATVTRRASPASFSESKFPSHGKRSSMPLGWIAGAVVVVVAGAAAWHFGLLPAHRGGDAEVAVPTPGAPAGSPAEPTAAGGAATAGGGTSGNAVETLQSPSVPLISVPAPGAAPAAGANAPATNAAVGTAVPQTAAPAAQPQAAPAQPAGAAPAPAAPPRADAAGTVAATAQPAAQAVASADGANALVLNVREDSWIEVRPAKGGAPLISRLVKAGSTETVKVDQPVRVVVGNPAGVSATLRGNAVALPAVPGKTLSRVSLQ